MDDYGGQASCCYFHPKEEIVGICALCLKERLLILASNQRHLPQPKDTQRSFRVLRRRPNITLPKVFARGSFLHRLDSRHPKSGYKSGYECEEGAITSLEDSFISIKFEDDGQATWDERKAVSIEPSPNPVTGAAAGKKSEGLKSVVEHAKPLTTMRWRKRIGHLLQLVRWKRSNKACTRHVGLGGKVEGFRERRGWIKSLTRRRTTSTE